MNQITQFVLFWPVRRGYQTARNRYKKQLDWKKLNSYRRRLVCKIEKKYGRQFTVYSIQQNMYQSKSWKPWLAPWLAFTNKENVGFDQTKLATIIPEQESDVAFVIIHTTFAYINKFLSETRNNYSLTT